MKTNMNGLVKIESQNVTVCGEQITYKLELDPLIVRYMLGKAYNNKTGISRDGALMLTITQRAASNLNKVASDTATN